MEEAAEEGLEGGWVQDEDEKLESGEEFGDDYGDEEINSDEC